MPIEDRSDSSTVIGYKCARCGNAFAEASKTCPICGFTCSDETCQIVAISKEGF